MALRLSRLNNRVRQQEQDRHLHLEAESWWALLQETYNRENIGYLHSQTSDQLAYLAERLYKEMQKADLQEGRGSAFQISNALREALFPKMGQTRFIYRAAYAILDRELAETMAESINPAARRFHVVGANGVGKTCWLLRQLILLVKQGQTVIMQPQDRNTAFLFSRHGCAEGPIESFSTELHESTSYYLVDSSAPHNYAGKTVLAATSATPRGTNAGQAFSASSSKAYLDDIPLNEMWRMARVQQSDKTREEIKRLHAKFGLSGRSCLDLKESIALSK